MAYRLRRLFPFCPLIRGVLPFSPRTLCFPFFSRALKSMQVEQFVPTQFWRLVTGQKRDELIRPMRKWARKYVRFFGCECSMRENAQSEPCLKMGIDCEVFHYEFMRFSKIRRKNSYKKCSQFTWTLSLTWIFCSQVLWNFIDSESENSHTSWSMPISRDDSFRNICKKMLSYFFP